MSIYNLIIIDYQISQEEKEEEIKNQFHKDFEYMIFFQGSLKIVIGDLNEKLK